MTNQQKLTSKEFWKQANAYIYDDTTSFNQQTFMKLYKQMMKWHLLSDEELWLLKDEGLQIE